MPFIKVEFRTSVKLRSSSEELTIIPSSEEVPIFFISELGDGLDLIPLLTEIDLKMGGKNPIYIYCHPTLKANEQNSVKSLEQTAEIIAKELEGQLKAPFHPCIIVSTTIASSLALLTTQYLEAQKRETFLCILEGATPELFKNYFLTQALPGTIDILKLFEKSAVRVGLDLPNLTKPEIEIISQLPLEKRIKQITEIFISQQKLNPNHPKLIYFKKLIQVTIKYFEHLTQYQPYIDATQTKLNIFTLLSKESIDKFNQQSCGWDEYMRSEMNHSYIFDKAPDFLNQDKELIASLIVNYINANVNEEYLVAKMWKDVAVDIDDYEKKHKKVKLLKKIKHVINSSAAKISANTTKKADVTTDNPLSIDEPKEKVQHKSFFGSETETFFLRRNNTFPMFGRTPCLDSSKDKTEKESRINLLSA